MNDFVSLAKTLEGYFDKPLKELPNALRERVLRDFSEVPRGSSPQAIWDELPLEQRRYRAEEWDCHNDPAMAEDMEYWKTKREKMFPIEKRLAQWEATACKTAIDLDIKEKRIEALREELAPMQKEQDRGDYPPDFELECHDGSGELAVSSSRSPCQPVSAIQIRRNFRVRIDEDANDKWWKKKMRDANRNGLVECRAGCGKPGPGGSLWRPDLIAGWLVDRHKKNKDGLNSAAARAALRKFPGLEEIADEFFSPDE